MRRNEAALCVCAGDKHSDEKKKLCASYYSVSARGDITDFFSFKQVADVWYYQSAVCHTLAMWANITTAHSLLHTHTHTHFKMARGRG